MKTMKKKMILVGLAMAFGAQAFAAPGAAIVVDRESVRERTDREGREGGERARNVTKDVVEGRKLGLKTSVEAGTDLRAVDFSKARAANENSTVQMSAREKADQIWGKGKVAPADKAPVLGTHKDADMKAEINGKLQKIQGIFGKEVRGHLESLPSSLKADGLVLFDGLSDAALASEANKDGLTREEYLQLARDIIRIQKATGEWVVNTQVIVHECKKKLDREAMLVLFEIFKGAENGEDIINNALRVKGGKFGFLGEGREGAERLILALDGIKVANDNTREGATECHIVNSAAIAKTAKFFTPALLKLAVAVGGAAAATAAVVR